MDGRFFTFRTHGIMQKPSTNYKDDAKVVEHKSGSDDIFIPSDDVIDFSAAKTETKNVTHNVVDLEDVKVIDRDQEGILEFTTEGSKKKSKPKKKRISTIKDYVKTRGDKYETMDYINIDDEDMGVKPKKKAEPVPELDYISIDEEEEVKPKDKRVGKAVKFEQGTPTEGEARRSPEGGKNETFNCPNCGETIMIPSSRRPITLKCPGCKSKGVLRY